MTILVQLSFLFITHFSRPILGLSVADGGYTGNQSEKSVLIDQLLLNYRKNVQPNDLVQIAFSIDFQQIISIEEKSQVMNSKCIIRQTWFDSRLAFMSDKFPSVAIPAKDLWKPDTYFTNSVDSTNGFVDLNDQLYADVFGRDEVLGKSCEFRPN